jgi:3-keto-disaccharide hydrolase
MPDKRNSISFTSVLLLAVIFVSLISLLVNTLEQPTTATSKISTDKDHSDSMNRQRSNIDVGMSIKNKSSASGNDDSSFTSIFDGKTLDGWKMAGDGRFVIVESDIALQSDKGGGLLWYAEKEYKNFILKLEWKVSDECDNSGVFVRFPDPDDNPNIAVREGYEVQIDSKAGDPIHQTGAIYDFAAQSRIVSKPTGQWNTMEIQALDQSYIVIINGEKVTEFTGSKMTEGYVGLQAHDDKSKVSFRYIMVKEIK